VLFRSVDDVREVLRLGLIGDGGGLGGMEQAAAAALIRRHVDPFALAENIPAAAAVLGAALYGVDDEPVGKAEGASEEPTPSPPTDA
jgi:hypothetical protein